MDNTVNSTIGSTADGTAKTTTGGTAPWPAPTIGEAESTRAAAYPNPLVAGFNPDPSVVKVGVDYYVVTSTFEYLPGIPVYHSTDLITWAQVGNVVTREEQIDLRGMPTLGGVWAPTIRHHRGVFYVIVTVAMGGGCLVFRTEDPAGEWSNPLRLDGIEGIDPDLAWDDDGAGTEDGTAWVTFSGLSTTGPDAGAHHGVQQARVDLRTGAVLEAPRSLWSGTGLKFPEAPHLYHRGRWWYLMIAEGGTERGHGVSIARGPSPTGPFTGFAGNPFLSARSTGRPIQNTGHGDLVEAPDGGTVMVLLGMRPRGMTQAFSALGRETFITTVVWRDGWPVADPVELHPREGTTAYTADFGGSWESGSSVSPLPPGLDAGWMAVRRHPSAVASFDARAGSLVITGDGSTMDDAMPSFIGRRQLNQTATVTTTLTAEGATGGLTVRYDEDHHVDIEVTGTAAGNSVVGRMRLAGIRQEWTAELPAGAVDLALDFLPVGAGFGPTQLSSDTIRLSASAGGVRTVLASLDGRYLTAETAASFTGRVVGLYAVTGTVRFARFEYLGSED